VSSTKQATVARPQTSSGTEMERKTLEKTRTSSSLAKVTSLVCFWFRLQHKSDCL